MAELVVPGMGAAKALGLRKRADMDSKKRIRIFMSSV